MQFIFTLAGHNFRPTECKAALAEAHHGTDHSLDLELDPTNEYDPNAVKVMLTVLSDEYFVGFIPKDTALDVAAILRDDEGSVALGHTSEINELRILDWSNGDKKPTILLELSTGWEVPTDVQETPAAEGADD